MKKIQLILLFALFGQVVMTNEVNVYTSRHYDSDPGLYEEFTKETGIKVNIISGKGSALLERLFRTILKVRWIKDLLMLLPTSRKSTKR